MAPGRRQLYACARSSDWRGQRWSLAQAGVRFALDNPSTSTVMVGFSDEVQIDAAVAAAGAEPLTADVRAKLQALWAADVGFAQPR